MSENETTGAAPATPTIHRRTNADRFVEHIQIANAKIQGHLDVASLRRLLDLGQADFEVVAQQILEAINAVVRGEPADNPVRFTQCPRCDAPLAPESPDIVVANLVTWQKSQPAYFQWSPFDLKRLLEHLHSHPGHVMLPPAAAHSVTIRRPDGGIYSYRHDGKVS